MKRQFFNVLALVSLMAFTTAVAGWVASARRPISVSVFDLSVKSSTGGFPASRVNVAFSAEGDKLSIYLAHQELPVDAGDAWRWHYILYRTTMIGKSVRARVTGTRREHGEAIR